MWCLGALGHVNPEVEAESQGADGPVASALQEMTAEWHGAFSFESIAVGVRRGHRGL